MGLMNGKVEPAGTTIIEASRDDIAYEVKNHKYDVCISSNFTNYLNKIGDIDKMSEMGIISHKVAHIIKEKLDKLAAEENASLLTKENADKE